MLEERRLPGAKAMGVVGGQVHVTLPFVAQLGGGAGDAKVLEGFGFEEMLDGQSFSTASEARYVDEVDGFRSAGVH